MSWLVTLIGLGLFAMWVIALISGGVIGWFLWLTFAAAAALVAIGVAGGVRRTIR